MTCGICQAPIKFVEVQVCWCQQDLCPECVKTHVPTCPQKGVIAKAEPSERTPVDPTAPKSRQWFSAREALTGIKIGEPPPSFHELPHEREE